MLPPANDWQSFQKRPAKRISCDTQALDDGMRPAATAVAMAHRLVTQLPWSSLKVEEGTVHRSKAALHKEKLEGVQHPMTASTGKPPEARMLPVCHALSGLPSTSFLPQEHSVGLILAVTKLGEHQR